MRGACSTHRATRNMLWIGLVWLRVWSDAGSVASYCEHINEYSERW